MGKLHVDESRDPLILLSQGPLLDPGEFDRLFQVLDALLACVAGGRGSGVDGAPSLSRPGSEAGCVGGALTWGAGGGASDRVFATARA